jgi:plasmid maintenance system antidote protein VapI
MLNASTVRPEDIRAEIARRRILLYRLAAVVGLSPNRLSLVLNEHVPLTPELAQRISAALNQDAPSR